LKSALYSLVANELADTVVDLVGRLRGIAWSKGAKDQEHGDDDGGENHELAENRPAVAELLPLHATLAEVLLELLTTKLVVDEATKRNAVTKGLEETDGVLEEEHGREDEENVLEYTGESEDERRGLANLETCERVFCAGENNERTRKTTETLSKKATEALANRVKRPTRSMSAMVIEGSSVKSKMAPLITAQAGA
jgi:hypothetical protein